MPDMSDVFHLFWIILFQQNQKGHASPAQSQSIYEDNPDRDQLLVFDSITAQKKTKKIVRSKGKDGRVESVSVYVTNMLGGGGGFVGGGGQIGGGGSNCYA